MLLYRGLPQNIYISLLWRGAQKRSAKAALDGQGIRVFVYQGELIYYLLFYGILLCWLLSASVFHVRFYICTLLVVILQIDEPKRFAPPPFY